MKQTMKTTRMITMGLFTLGTMGLSQATFAGLKTGDPMELKFIGKTSDNPVFQLNLNNNEAGEYFINIKDEDRNLLYSERVKAKEANFSRKYQLALENGYGFGVTVEVTSIKTHKTQVYKISKQTTVNENITVAEL